MSDERNLRKHSHSKDSKCSDNIFNPGIVQTELSPGASGITLSGIALPQIIYSVDDCCVTIVTGQVTLTLANPGGTELPTASTGTFRIQLPTCKIRGNIVYTISNTRFNGAPFNGQVTATLSGNTLIFTINPPFAETPPASSTIDIVYTVTIGGVCSSKLC